MWTWLLAASLWGCPESADSVAFEGEVEAGADQAVPDGALADARVLPELGVPPPPPDGAMDGAAPADQGEPDLGVLACPSGFVDLDGLAANGCEAGCEMDIPIQIIEGATGAPAVRFGPDDTLGILAPVGASVRLVVYGGERPPVNVDLGGAAPANVALAGPEAGVWALSANIDGQDVSLARFRLADGALGRVMASGAGFGRPAIAAVDGGAYVGVFGQVGPTLRMFSVEYPAVGDRLVVNSQAEAAWALNQRVLFHRNDVNQSRYIGVSPTGDQILFQDFDGRTAAVPVAQSRGDLGWVLRGGTARVLFATVDGRLGSLEANLDQAQLGAPSYTDVDLSAPVGVTAAGREIVLARGPDDAVMMGIFAADLDPAHVAPLLPDAGSAHAADARGEDLAIATLRGNAVWLSRGTCR